MVYQNAMIGWQNAALTGALAVSSAEAALPAVNLQNQQGAAAMAWQTTGCEAEWLMIDTGDTAQTWQALVLARTNLTPDATIRLRIGTNVGGGGIASLTYDSGVVPAGVVVDGAVGYQQAVAVLASEQTGSALRIDIMDPTNPDGYINVPLVFAGPVFQPLSNQDYSGTQGRLDSTTNTVTRGGQEFPLTPWTQRYADVSFQGIRASEAWSAIMQIDQAARTNQNVLWIPVPGGVNQGREAVFGRLVPSGGMTYPYQSADRRGYKFRITERI